MHNLPSNALAIIQARADRCTNIAVIMQFLEKAIHPAETEIWKNAKSRIVIAQDRLRAEECRIKQVAKERWDKAERGTEQEFIWVVRYIELTSPLLKDEILTCNDIGAALIGWKTAEKTDPSSTLWYFVLRKLQEREAMQRAENCIDYREAAIEFKNAEEDTTISAIWFSRYITLRYH